MRIFSKRTIKQFWEKYPDSEEALRTWYRESSGRMWENPHQLKAHFGQARVLGTKRIIFNISGNKYRLVTEVNYSRGWMFVRFIGTHAEYDQIDPNTI